MYFCDLILFISAALLTVGFEVAYGGNLLPKLNKVFYLKSICKHHLFQNLKKYTHFPFDHTFSIFRMWDKMD